MASGGIRSMLGAAEPWNAPEITCRMPLPWRRLPFTSTSVWFGLRQRRRAEHEKLERSGPCVWAVKLATIWFLPCLRFGWSTWVMASGGIRSMLGAAEPWNAPEITCRMPLPWRRLPLTSTSVWFGLRPRRRAESEKLERSVPCVWAVKLGTIWVSTWFRFGWPTWLIASWLSTWIGAALSAACMPTARVPVTMMAPPSSTCGDCASWAIAQADQDEASTNERRSADNLVIYAPCSAFIYDKGLNEVPGRNLYRTAQNDRKN